MKTQSRLSDLTNCNRYTDNFSQSTSSDTRKKAGVYAFSSVLFIVPSQSRSKFLYSLQEGTSMTSSASFKNVEEDVLEEESDGALEEVNSHIKSVFEILKSETIKVRKEMKAFDTMAKKLKHVHFSKTLKLNVGGQLFSTSLETMRKDPGKSAPCISCMRASIFEVNVNFFK